MGKKQKGGKAKAHKTTAKTQRTDGASKKDRKQEKKAAKQKQVLCSRRGDLAAELAAFGLQIKHVAADGNCLFRAVADQLEGGEEQHSELRQTVLKYVEDNPDSFEPFIEDDEAFDDYVARMRKDGAWGGHIELSAASLLLGINIAVHQSGQPCWTIQNFPKGRTIHISYHDQEHYNSVRVMGDLEGPAREICLEAQQADGTGAPDVTARSGALWGPEEEAEVTRGTGSGSLDDVRQELLDAKGSVAEAIEVLVARSDAAAVEEDAVATPAAEGSADITPAAAGAALQEKPAAGVAGAAADAVEASQSEQSSAPLALKKGMPGHESCTPLEEGIAPSTPVMSDAASRLASEELAWRENSCTGTPDEEASSSGVCAAGVAGEATGAATSPAAGAQGVPEAEASDRDCSNDLLSVKNQPTNNDGDSAGPETSNQPMEAPNKSASKPTVAKSRKVKVKAGKAATPGRNQKCSCGSRKKYKNCCGAAKAAGSAKSGEADPPSVNAAPSAQLRTLFI